MEQVCGRINDESFKKSENDLILLESCSLIYPRYTIVPGSGIWHKNSFQNEKVLKVGIRGSCSIWRNGKILKEFVNIS